MIFFFQLSDFVIFSGKGTKAFKGIATYQILDFRQPCLEKGLSWRKRDANLAYRVSIQFIQSTFDVFILIVGHSVQWRFLATLYLEWLVVEQNG